MPARQSTPATRLVATALIALFVASGCGYRGPLYLPDEPPPAPEDSQQADPGPAESTATDLDGEEDEDSEDSPDSGDLRHR